MPALEHDVTIEQGADFQREYTVTNLDGSNVTDLGSFQFSGQLRTNYGTLVADFTITPTSVKTELAALTAAQTTLAKASTCYSHNYDIEGVSPQGIVYRIAKVRAKISAEQTKTA